jgi:ribosomal protein S18 acetylase RimI-like enzyme
MPYKSTWSHYEALGFRKVAELPYFYRKGGGNLFHMKELMI